MLNGKKVIGVIAEFNPLHEGHRYLLREARGRFRADYLVAAMSGDFVQRGEPAFLSKYDRTREALLAGADLVIQIPVLYSTQSAEGFAMGGVMTLQSLGFVDELLFGSESGELERLSRIADFLGREDRAGTDFSQRIRRYLKEGMGYPGAREQVLRAMGVMTEGECPLPNDVLGIEYLKALSRLKSTILPRCLTRASVYPSAHRIREAQKKEAGNHGQYADVEQLSEMLSYRLISLSMAGIPFHEYLDVDRDLSCAIGRQLEGGNAMGFRERVSDLQGKNRTYHRVQRALLHLLLGIRREDVLSLRSGTENPPEFSWLRVLGIRKEKKELLSASAAYPLFNLGKDRHRKEELFQDRSLQLDLFAAGLYHLLLPRARNEFTEMPLML